MWPRNAIRGLIRFVVGAHNTRMRMDESRRIHGGEEFGMPEQQSNSDALHIKESADGQRQYVFHPENDDLFVRTGRQVIAACQLGISMEVWIEELVAMLDVVRAWTTKRAARVRACYCAPRGAKVILFFVPVSDHVDFDLADELTDLNTELVNTFNVGMIEVRQVPGDELDRFITLDAARQVYGGQSEPHRPVEA